ncbi:MAG: hypothetical protein ACJ74W_24115 [Pyrinomonadaceae bacterium]
MFNDPLMRWESGLCPYDALAEVGITAASDMRHVDDALYTLIERGLLTPERRAAWSELRLVEGRLRVDLLLYPVTLEKILEVFDRLADVGEAESAAADIEHLLSLAAEELSRAGGEPLHRRAEG